MSFLILLSVFISSGSNAFAAGHWVDCVAEEDCQVTDSRCYGPLALHKKFVKENAEDNKRFRPLAQCAPYTGPKLERYRAVCKSNKCVLVLK